MNPVIKIEFSDAYFFHEGLAAVNLNDKWGFIDKRGNMVISPSYRAVRVETMEPIDMRITYLNFEYATIIYQKPFFTNNGTARVESGLIDKTGKTVIRTTGTTNDQNKYSSVGDIVEGFAIVKSLENGKAKYGFVNASGAEVIASQYDLVRNFNDGVALVKKNNKWSYIDKTGKLKFPGEFDEAYSFSDGMALVIGDDGKMSWYIDNTGKKVTESRSTNFINLQKNNSTGNYQGVAQISPFNPYLNGYALVKGNEKWMILDKKGKAQPVETDVDDILPPVSIYGVVKFKKNGKIGLMDYKGRQITSPVYDRIGTFVNGAAIFLAGKTAGFIDAKGKEIYKTDLLLDVTDKWSNFTKNGFAEILILGKGQFYIDRAGREYRAK